jgi:hypothetical protein
MKTKYLLLGSHLVIALISGLIVRYYYTRPLPNPNIPISHSIVSPVIPANPDLTCDDAKKKLRRYETDLPEVRCTLLEQSQTNLDVMISGNLYERKFLEEVEFKLVAPKVHRHIVQINYLFTKKINTNYYYKIFDNLALGGGVVLPLTSTLGKSELLIGGQMAF